MVNVGQQFLTHRRKQQVFGGAIFLRYKIKKRCQPEPAAPNFL